MPICANCGAELPPRSRFCPACGTPVTATAEREQRKTVTVLFCDVTGSTALGDSTDPEAMRTVLARYFGRMKAIVESHGGSVEKFIGDAVMAVFGVPAVHEDDALRAVRAAQEMRDALPELGLEARIGINTGEVVTGTEERLATGDAVNVAARLQQAASPGEILLGTATVALVRGAVETERVPPLELKGKAKPVESIRLLLLTGEESICDLEAPLVGRKIELRRLLDAYEQAVHDRSGQLFTVLGAAGVGKSRLTAEFLTHVGGRVVRGRCPAYGEGITYWPLVEVLMQLQTRLADETAAAAIASLLGESDEPTTSDEIAWAARKTLERAADERPLVCLFEDLHWGEPAFFDLIEHVAEFSREHPILLLCLARPELLERRPGWGGGKPNATTLLLEPLSPKETDELIERLASVSPEARARIREAAEGNPLFVEEMLAIARSSGEGELAIPPTIQALLAARLDQLEPSERALLERGAVEGRLFHESAVQALAPQDTEVPKRLLALVRTELVRPDRPLVAGDAAFRFRHQLIRDAAYDAVPKALRAELHERLAGWVEEHGTELVEQDELVGYHLEQACRYRAELGAPEERQVAAKARAAFLAAGRRASLRGDTVAAANLLERALALVPIGEIDLALELDLIDALFFGGGLSETAARARTLIEHGLAHGDHVSELCGRLWEVYVDSHVDPDGATDRLVTVVDDALPVLETAGEDRALSVAYMALARAQHMRAKEDSAVEAVERGLACARRLGLPHLEARLMIMAGAFRLYGTAPVSETLRWLDEQEARGLRKTSLRATRASALANLGRFDEARSLLAEQRKYLAERGAKLRLALLAGLVAAEVELLAGNPAVALELAEEGFRMFEELGEKGWRSDAAGNVAEASYQLDRLEEADACADRVKQVGATTDAVAQSQWRQVRAKVLARRGESVEAERLAREAVVNAESTDRLNMQGDALRALAEVLTAAGRTDEAAAALEQALERYERKENLAMVAQVTPTLEELRARVS